MNFRKRTIRFIRQMTTHFLILILAITRGMAFNNCPMIVGASPHMETSVASSEKTLLEITPKNITKIVNANDWDSINSTMYFVPTENIALSEDILEIAHQADENMALYADFSEDDDFINDCSTNYGFLQLEENPNVSGMETLYLNILEIAKSIYNGTEDIKISDFDGNQRYCAGKVNYADLGLTTKDVFEVYNSVLYDHPLFYFFGKEIAYDGVDLYLLVDENFCTGQSRHSYAEKIKSQVTAYTNITENAMSNYDIVKAVHDTIITSVEYGFESDGITPKDTVFTHSIAGYVTDEKLLVCDGYAKTFATILNYLDIENVFVAGWSVASGAETSDETAHAWNLVRLGNDSFYFVDTTLDDGSSDGIQNDYLCIGKELYKNHSIVQNGASDQIFFMYKIPEVAETSFAGNDILKKSPDPEYIKTDNFTYSLENGILTFSGRGSITGSEENYTENPWYALRENVTSLVFEEGIRFIGNYTFCDFDNVTSISFSEGQSIGFRAFADCSALKEVTLPDQMPYMGGEIFADCTALEKVTYGQLSTDCNVYYIGDPFRGDINLQTIVVPENNFLYESQDNVLFLKTEKLLDLYPEGKRDTVYTIPEGTKGISNAFYNCRFLEQILIPESVETVFTSAFVNCSALKSLSFPASVKQFYDDPVNEGIPSISQCNALDYIENKSDAKLYLEESYVLNESEKKYYRYWKDNTTNKVKSYISQGTVVPEYFGIELGNFQGFTEDGITYQSQTEPPSPPLSADDLENNVFAGTVKVINLSPSHMVSDIPDTVKYNGWIYKVVWEVPTLSITCSPNRHSIHIGESCSISTAISQSADFDISVSWRSSDENIATVDEHGQVFAISSGKATIFATASGRFGELVISNTASCELTVTSLAENTQTIQSSDINKTYGDADFQIKASTTGDGILSFNSSNENVVAVDSKSGLAKITGAGTVNITIEASETDNYKKAVKTICITVNKADPRLKLTKKSYRKTFGASPFNPGISAKANISYKTNNSKVAIVRNGKIIIKSCGTAIITVSTTDSNYKAASGKISIHVVPKKASISNAVSKKSGQISVSWKKQKEAAGYTIEYSTDKKFKKVVKTMNVDKNKITKTTLKKLKKKKIYYIRVKAFTKVNKKILYGNASKSIKCKTK